MSDETAQQLEEARAEEARQQAVADGFKQECLASIARGIPARVDEIAKKMAHNEAEVTKALGVDGIKAFRAELADQAAAIASELEAASDQIQWPTAVSVNTHGIHHVLFEFLYGARLARLAAIPKRHGFSVADGGSLKSPQSLYDQNGFGELAEVLTSLAKATRAVATAKAADDEDIVSSMWAEG